MTLKPVDQISPGPTLDTAAARALGWQRMLTPSDFGEGVVECWWDGVSKQERFVPSLYIGDAWTLLNYLKRPGYIWWSIDLKNWHVFIGAYEGPIVADADSQPLAITRAFLKASGITELEIEQ